MNSDMAAAGGYQNGCKKGKGDELGIEEKARKRGRCVWRRRAGVKERALA
jgi:hypothetical protein